MSKIKWMAGSCFAMALALLAWGCAGSAGPAAPLNTVSGQHSADWLQVHYVGYVQNPNQCRTCHGSTTDSTQAGGISKVSCFTCHTTGVPHPAGWAASGQHGRLGAQFAPSTDPKVMAGFAHCAKCHGSDYTGGIAASSCMACHTKAPHPARPWRGTPATQPSHVATHINNAPECFKCHAAGANSTLKPLTVPPAGTQPGCYNDTMCHSNTVT